MNLEDQELNMYHHLVQRINGKMLFILVSENGILVKNKFNNLRRKYPDRCYNVIMCERRIDE